MKKKYIIILLIVVSVTLGIIVGVSLFNRNKTLNIEQESKSQLAKENIQNEIEIIETSNKEIKTSPNCMFVFETYFKECNHTTNEKLDIPNECINKTEEDLQEKYKEFAIKEFASNEVIFYTEKEGICAQHYIVKDNNGYVAIYTINSLGKEILQETTEIATIYLPQIDKDKLKDGIKANGKEELNALIEDYE